MNELLFTMLTFLLTLSPVTGIAESEQEYYIAPTAVYAAENTEFLHDLDYLLYALENNFALFDVAYWAHGMDIRQSIDNIRVELLANPHICADEFFAALARETTAFGNIGHLGVVWPFQHLQTLSAFGYDIFRQENVMNFYVPRHTNEALDSNMMADLLMTMGEVNFNNYLLRISLFGEEELAERIAYERKSGNYDKARLLLVQAIDIIDNIPNIYTKIIEEGRIAYLTINTFGRMLDTGEGRTMIFDFYEDIRGFDHLIIDLRRNGGGRWEFFREAVIRPNITERIQLYGFAFAIDGKYVEEQLNDLRANRMIRVSGFTPDPLGSLRPVNEILETYNLPDINLADMERMQYGIRLITTTLTPRRAGGVDLDPAFEGKIWLLTGPLTSSAAEIATRISMEAGFATHVGETSEGNYGGPRTFLALPNTGILISFDAFYITDSRGRPFEAGTVPHHFNMEGMDALETTLALIALGEY